MKADFVSFGGALASRALLVRLLLLCLIFTANCVMGWGSATLVKNFTCVCSTTNLQLLHEITEENDCVRFDNDIQMTIG